MKLEELWYTFYLKFIFIIAIYHIINLKGHYFLTKELAKEVLNNPYSTQLTAASLAISQSRHWVSRTARGATSSNPKILMKLNLSGIIYNLLAKRN